MCNYISEFNNNLICKHLFGFGPKHSTQQTVISLVNNINNTIVLL